MNLTAGAVTYLRHGFAQLLAVADRLDEPAINTRPLGPHTNAVADGWVDGNP